MIDVSRDRSDYRHVVTMTVRYDDLDTYRHVNNKKFLTYLEDARIHYLHSVAGFGHHLLDDYGVVIAHQAIDYWKVILFGDLVHAYTKCVRIGTRSMEFHHLLEVERSGEVERSAEDLRGTNQKRSDDSVQLIPVAGADSVLVSIDPKTGSPINNHPEIVRRLREYEPQSL